MKKKKEKEKKEDKGNSLKSFFFLFKQTNTKLKGWLQNRRRRASPRVQQYVIFLKKSSVSCLSSDPEGGRLSIQ